MAAQVGSERWFREQLLSMGTDERAVGRLVGSALEHQRRLRVKLADGRLGDAT